MALFGKLFRRFKDAGKVVGGSAVAVTGLEAVKRFLGEILKEKGAEEAWKFIRASASGKGLENENIWGRILDQCDLNTEQRRLLLKAIKELRAQERTRQIADNFVIAVALGNPSDEGIYPGGKIIDGFIHRLDEFPSEKEKLFWIKENIINIGTNAQIETWVGEARKFLVSCYKKTTQELEEMIKEFNESAQQAAREYESLPRWKRIFFNN